MLQIDMSGLGFWLDCSMGDFCCSFSIKESSQVKTRHSGGFEVQIARGKTDILTAFPCSDPGHKVFTRR